MLGQHNFQPDITIYFNLETFIPANHLLRKIDQQINFAFIQQLTAACYCPNNGRPSIDPEVFFRMLLIGYLYGIDTDRRLCEEVQYNLAYRWFCHLSLSDSMPDHSSFTRIRDRFKVAMFKKFFTEIVKQCQTKGLVKGKRVVSDSSLIAADAALDSLVANESTPSANEHSHSSNPSHCGFGVTRRKINNKTHTSKTDPEATLAVKPGTPVGLKYKIHFTADADSRVILDIYVTTGACHDSQVYLQQLKNITNEYQLSIE